MRLTTWAVVAYESADGPDIDGFRLLSRRLHGDLPSPRPYVSLC